MILLWNYTVEYGLYCRLLKFFFERGLRVTKKHKVIRFNQDYIRKEYLLNNTNKINIANTDADKDMWRLMNNPLFGRLCVNLMNFCQTKFLHDEEKISKSVSKPIFKNVNRYNEYRLVDYSRRLMENNSSLYLGKTVLELSVTHLDNFFYEVLEPNLKDLKLHFTDTDSLVLSFTEGSIDKEHNELGNLDVSDKTCKKSLVSLNTMLVVQL